jgi:hypothetical protein
MKIASNAIAIQKQHIREKEKEEKKTKMAKLRRKSIPQKISKAGSSVNFMENQNEGSD